jgi:hypothetical protein
MLPFPPDYATARAQFLDACDEAGLRVQTHRHPLAAPDGSPLATDVVRIGPASARRCLVLTSGAHGPELMAGSACQGSWLRAGGARRLPLDTAVLLVHAINPWGTAHRRRNTEDNVDFCRNWIDFGKALPSNDAYEPLHAAVTIEPGHAQAVADADAMLERHRLAQGTPALYGALMAGQYRHPDGLGFGGTAPTWSRRTMEAILGEHAAQARRVCLVDYHTGVGPYAYGSIVALQVGEALARARAAFGGWVIAPNEAGRPADYVPVTGHTTPGYERALSQAEVLAVVLEFGTHPPGRMLELLLADHRQTFARSRDEAALHAARQRVESFFLPDDPHWRVAVRQRSEQVIQQALEHLTAP